MPKSNAKPPRRHAAARFATLSNAAAAAALVVAAAGACGGASSGVADAGPPVDTTLFEGPPFYEQDEPSNELPGTSAGGLDGLVDENDPPPTGATNVPEACVIAKAAATLIRQPVDIVLLLDNSGSMSDELGAVEANINESFASILTTSDVDYRMILLSRHRQEPRDDSDEASTSICVSSPLSGLDDCDEADEPAFSERFFQYSTKLESSDSFDVLLDTYAPPFDESEREEKFDKAPSGWSEWLREGAKKVFLEMTDDDEDMPIGEFVEALQSLGPEHFGSDPAAPNFVFHSIIGLAEKSTPTDAYRPDEAVQEETCTGNDNDVENAGESYQELSRMTGGLRFPLCQFGAYDVVFRRIAEDVVLTRQIACDVEIPPEPAGRALDLNNVAIEYSRADGAAPVQFGQAPDLGSCQADAFYIADGRLNLCPETCSSIRGDRTASMTVLFTCQSQLIVPR
jgi:hypothetical protein